MFVVLIYTGAKKNMGSYYVMALSSSSSSVRPSVDRMVSKVVADGYFFILSAMILGTE